MNRLLALRYGLLVLMVVVTSLAMATLLWAGGWAHVGARNALLVVVLLCVAVTVAGGVGAALLVSTRPALARPAQSAVPVAEAPVQPQRADAVLRAALLGQHLGAAGQLGSRVAHELGSLLGTISTSAQLIERRNADPDVAVLVDSILRSVETAGRLAQQLPRLAAQPTQPSRRIELAEELPRQRELLETVLGPQVGLSIEVAADAGAVEVDPGELTLALVNLAFNASQAIRGVHVPHVPHLPHVPHVPHLPHVPPRKRGTSLGRVRLIVRAAAPEPGEAMPAAACALVCMVDDGIGIDEALVGRVFEPFFSTRPPGAGWGLGLSQVAAFCERAGGRARLRSTPGLGTAVSMLLPAAPPPAGAVSVIADSVPKDEWLRGRHLLIVDSSDEFAGFAAALLAGRGCRLSRARDAGQALEAFGEGQAAVDLAVCAAELPEDIDGIALARLLRRRDPRLGIVLRGAAPALQGAREAVVVPWPCTPPQLLTALRQAAR